MIKNMKTRISLVIAAFALSVVGGAVVAPAAAQGSSETASAQMVAESLVSALNGRRGDRRTWGRENLASDRLRGAQIERLDTLAIRNGEITLTDVSNAENSMVLAISTSRGRSGTINMVLDEGRPDRILTFAVNGL